MNMKKKIKVFDGEKELQEKINNPAVRQRFIERKEKLLKDYDFYLKKINAGCKFQPHVTGYYKTIYYRLREVDYILENVV